MRGERLEGILQSIVFNDHDGSGYAEIVGPEGVDYIGFNQAALAPRGRIRLYEDKIRMGRVRPHVVKLSDAMIASGRLTEAA